jgi:RHS repeat-associated protein
LAETGSLRANLSYQPLGARRSGDWLSPSPTTTEWQEIDATTDRGYTGHEHLDNLGIIHMNGRVYDPVLGRFLSPDPYVQAPRDGQSLNRYSYVRNNPLRYTDPSGYCFNGHPAADRAEEQCMEEIFIHAYGLSAAQISGLWDSFGAASLAQTLGQAANVPAGDLAAANGSIESMLVTAPRSDAADMFALDASMYASYPAWLIKAATSDLSQTLLFAGLTAAALLEPTPIGEVALGGEYLSESKMLSTVRLTRPGEKFLRYESNNRSFTRVTDLGGVRPGTYAAPWSDGLVPVSQRASMYNLPDPLILRTESFTLSPPPNTLIIGPRPVMGGAGNEVLFPYGF